MARLREIEHTADRAFRVRGKDLRELFTSAAEALFRLEARPKAPGVGFSREVEVQGFDRETLLVNWLNELLYLEEVRQEGYSRVDILDISDHGLKARLHGHVGRRAARRIKAVTFHGLAVRETGRGLEADIVVDV